MLNKFNNLIQKTMKKIITLLAVVAFVVSCSQSRKWTDKEREEVRKTLRDYRDRSAIRHMEAANYGNLEQCVLTTIEGTYPDYNKYDQLTAKEDTLNAAMVSCVGFSIGDNFENLPLLFPGGRVATGRYPARRRDRRTDPGLLYLPGRKGERTVRDAAAVYRRSVRAAGRTDRAGRRDATVRRFGGGSGRPIRRP